MCRSIWTPVSFEFKSNHCTALVLIPRNIKIELLSPQTHISYKYAVIPAHVSPSLVSSSLYIHIFTYFVIAGDVTKPGNCPRCVWLAIILHSTFGTHSKSSLRAIFSKAFMSCMFGGRPPPASGRVPVNACSSPPPPPLPPKSRLVNCGAYCCVLVKNEAKVAKPPIPLPPVEGCWGRWYCGGGGR